MVKVEASVMIDRPIEEVWKLITDMSKVPKWDTAVLEVRQTSTGPFGLSSTVEVRQKMRNMTFSQRVTEYEPNQKLSFETTSGPGKGTILTFSVETIEGKTRFTKADDPLKFSGIYKLLGPFITPMLKRESEAAVGNVKRVLESEAKS
jgi:uncharacterized protein YndB with AHSA1/START domain